MTIIFQRPDIDSQTRRLISPLKTSLALYTASFLASALLGRYLFHYAVAPSIALTLVYGLGLIILYAGQQRLGWIGAWLCICALFFYILSGNDFAFK
ncbi:MAG TPA: hypothetical protein VLC91_14785, partial [Spongiibacteraceae bacterium]|nr:hypothetical protein [Spongiibacteraceae bacterium]